MQHWAEPCRLRRRHAMVAVAAKNNSTGIVTTGTTNPSGALANSPRSSPGQYTVTATFAGFKTDVQRRRPGTKPASPAEFHDGGGQGRGNGRGNRGRRTRLAKPACSVGGVLSNRDVQTLPVPINVLDMITLTPGVVQIPGAFAPTVVAFMGTQTQDINTTRDGMVSSADDTTPLNGAYSGPLPVRT